jgi:hypothetical protein
MSFRAFPACRALALSVATAALAACGDGSGLIAVAGSGNAATVRFVNATATPLDLATGGNVNAGNANIASGGGVGCFSVADPAAPGLSVRQAGTTTDLSGFSPSFSANGRYTLIAYPGTAGFIQFISLPQASLSVAGRSALRVFHAAAGLGQVDVYVTTPGASLGQPRIAGVGFGSSTGSFDVAAGTMQVRLTNAATTTVVYDAGGQVLEAGKSYTLIISSATTTAILVPDC